MSSELALLGPGGTFSEEAAVRFAPDLNRKYCGTIEDVFESVLEGNAEYGIVPVENSLEGSVAQTLEMLNTSDVRVCREITLKINHCLMALIGTELSDIKEIVSHPHALGQCKKFIKTLPTVKTRNFSSTAEAAKDITDKKLIGTGAIASKIAAKLYGLAILKEGIQDNVNNQTRFFVISRDCRPENDSLSKTSIVIGLKDKPGALYVVLGLFAKADVNLTKIESRPTKKTLGDYIFYIDFIGNINEGKMKNLLDEVMKRSTHFKVFGSYSTDRE